jgi:hypothetical protein
MPCCWLVLVCWHLQRAVVELIFSKEIIFPHKNPAQEAGFLFGQIGKQIWRFDSQNNRDSSIEILGVFYDRA